MLSGFFALHSFSYALSICLFDFYDNFINLSELISQNVTPHRQTNKYTPPISSYIVTYLSYWHHLRHKFTALIELSSAFSLQWVIGRELEREIKHQRGEEKKNNAKIVKKKEKMPMMMMTMTATEQKPNKQSKPKFQRINIICKSDGCASEWASI